MSAYNKIFKGLMTGKLAEIDFPTQNEVRKLSGDELKNIVKEELMSAEETAKVKATEVPGGWGDADLERELEWMKVLKLSEFLKKG